MFVPSPVHMGRLPGRGVPTVNWRHPLAKSLIVCYYPTINPAGRITNLAFPGAGDLTTRTGDSAKSLAATPEGFGIPFTTTTASQASGPLPSTWHQNATSVFVRGQCNGQSGSLQLGVWIGSIGTDYNWVVGQGAQGASPGSMWIAHTNAVNTQFTTANSLFNTGQMTSFGGTFLQGSNPLAYVNGTPQPLTGAFPVNNTYPGSNTLAFGEQGSGNKVNSTLTIGYVWQRILTPQEYIYLDNNPYSLLLWPSDLAVAMISKPQAVTPATVVPSKSMIVAPMTIGLGAAASAERWLRRRKMILRNGE